MKKIVVLSIIGLLLGCKNEGSKSETNLRDISEKSFRTFKVEDSKFINLDNFWAPFENQLSEFSPERYQRLEPLILNQDIPTIQKHIDNGKFNYETLVTFYLYRIKAFDRDNEKSLNSVISLNPNILDQAREMDKNRPSDLSNTSIYGMPILLKDNINAKGLVTTAGAVALMKNRTDDSFLSKQLKASGALILGKANLSEWAYFFCGDCPSGYSAVGGQTFNPYGRKSLDTGGSSSGSAVAVAANFCAAAIGSETSGSILSPSSQNGAVGLKPTVGTVSRSGIVPISSTLDTAGPISKYIIDNVLLYNAIIGYDSNDFKSKRVPNIDLEAIQTHHLKGKRFGAIQELMKDTLYATAIEILKSRGVEIVAVEPQKQDLPGFLRLLNLDMKTDLPLYFNKHANVNLPYEGVQSIIDFNEKDSVARAPYGQLLFRGIVADTASIQEFEDIKYTLKSNGRKYFDDVMMRYRLDGLLSINNYHASYAAVAEYPGLTVPMGLTEKGEPKGLTFIGKPFQESDLYTWGYVFEKFAKQRPEPFNYQ